MIARALFRFHPARLHAPRRLPSKSFISPAYEHFTSNSFVSPTYAKTGGCTPPKMSARRHFLSLSSRSPLSALGIPLPAAASAEAGFLSFAHSFIFRITLIRNLSNTFRTLAPKTGGTPPLVQPIPGFSYEVRAFLFPLSCRLSTVDCWLLHSPRIHKAVTPPSPIRLPLLSQCSPVRGPTHTPCLSLSERVRYTSTDAIRSARSLHEARTDY
jgi:hypothetical protein